jgi:twitching motility protein PilT
METNQEKEKLLEIISMAFAKKASDVHFKSGVPPMFRIANKLDKEYKIKLTDEEKDKILLSTLDNRCLNLLKKDRKVDFAINLGEKFRLRANVFFQRGSLSGVFRIIPKGKITIANLGIPPVCKELANRPRGLIIISGPSGSGKTTTIASMVNEINSSKADHILTIEDPIEFLFTDEKSIINQREIGTDSFSYANALKGALREDPDTIIIGEMKDLETVSTAITTAETGHLVISCVHTTGAAETLDRIINMFPYHQQEQIRMQLSMNLQGIISQILLPRADGNGAVPVFEIFIPTFATRNLIRKNQTSQLKSAISMGKKDGSQSMEQAIRDLIKSKVITKEVGEAKIIELSGIKGDKK